MKTLTLSASLLVSLSVSLSAGPWTQWRGPLFNGSAPTENPPASFSPSSNVLWSVPMPGPGSATPAILSTHLLTTSADTASQTLIALSLDTATGNIRWRHEVAQGTKRDDRSNFAAPSPVTDGKHAWFYFSTGDLLCFTLDGTKVWQRNIQKDYGEFAFLWTFSSTPLLFDGRLYLQVLQRDVPVNGRGRKDGPIESFLLALDPATGRELWRHARPSDAVQESREAFTSPIPLQTDTRSEILVGGGDAITGHSPTTGAELWRWATWNPTRIPHWRLVASPVHGAGIILACAPKDAPVYAFKTGANGTLPTNAPAWVSSDRAVSSDVPTPLFHNGHFYILNGKRHTLSCVEPATGHVLWTGQLESNSVFESSPTASRHHIYCINHRGQLFVVEANPTAFKLVQTAEFGQADDKQVRSSIAIADHRLYIRTDTRLFAIGHPTAKP